MDNIILDNIEYKPNRENLMKELRISEGSSDSAVLDKMISEAATIARPKATYKISFVEAKDDYSVVIDGIKFTSRVLRVNLDKAHRVFPYLATCGKELDDWANSIDDMLYRYWADKIKEKALYASSEALNQHLVENYQLGRTSAMSPGSLENWPLPQQRPLFTIISKEEKPIGITLTDTFLMIPNKSISGILFQNEEGYANCQLCPREVCPNRRAPYDETLFNRKYML